MKIELLDLTFNREYFYIQKESIVEKITFNNRTLYSKFEKTTTTIDNALLQQHYANKISLAIPLIENNLIDYIVIEYQQNDWKSFYSLLQHLLKSLDVLTFFSYYNIEKELFQLFIPKNKTKLDLAYQEVENIKHLLELKSKKSYKIYPNKNLPKNLNIITLPNKKV